MQIPDTRLETITKHVEIHVRALGKGPLDRTYLVKYDSGKKKTVEIIGRIIRGGKKIGDFRKSEYPDEKIGTYGYNAPEGLLFVYRKVAFVESERLLSEMNGKGKGVPLELRGQELLR